MYPQPLSSKSVLEGQEFFRLNTPFQSNGDIYEIDTSVKAIVIGPDSDIQNVRCYYYDVQAPGQIGSALISVNDPFVTRMNAFMGQEYPTLGAKARVLVTADDLVPHGDIIWDGVINSISYDPLDLVVTVPPQIDLLCYHRDPPATPASRAERSYQFNLTINDRGAGSGVSWYAFPFYRRKYFHARFINVTLLPSIEPTYSIYGITFHPLNGAVYMAPGTTVQLLATGTIANFFSTPASNGVTSVPIYTGLVPDQSAPGVHSVGYFDYIAIVIEGDELDGSAFGISVDIITTDWA